MVRGVPLTRNASESSGVLPTSRRMEWKWRVRPGSSVAMFRGPPPLMLLLGDTAYRNTGGAEVCSGPPDFGCQAGLKTRLYDMV